MPNQIDHGYFQEFKRTKEEQKQKDLINQVRELRELVEEQSKVIERLQKENTK